MQSSLFDTRSAKSKYETIFRQAYQALNPEQKSAVDQIEGPVMVIAGPGTGKTQILAVRIGKILLETDAQAHNILCLTYTDAATISMRNRLVKIIGPAAHRVHIHTFHGFCNQVIQENLGLFGDYRQLEPISDLERVDVYKKIMKDLPDDHRLKRLKGDPQFEINRLRNLFSLMKKENYDTTSIDQAIESYYAALREEPKMYYSRSGKGYTKGDFKQKEYDKQEQRMEDLRAGAYLFEAFQAIMKDVGRYDYDDMILWVLKAFQSDPELLMQYQERYQYFLVDEFQDTNGSQKSVLDLLISFWADNPNVFVVGDDDQAIYKFQGANMGNIKSFRSQYDPSLVVLVKNYRSTQRILNAAMGVIDFNAERIVKQPDFGLNKDLVAMAAHKDDARDVHITSYANIIQEQAAIAERLQQRYRDEGDISDVAILYRNHRQVEKLVEVLEKKGVPLNIKRKVDILKMPLVRNVLNILNYINGQYLNKGYTDKRLFELMHYNFFHIRSHDIATLIWETRNLRDYDQEDQDTGRTPLGKLIADKERLLSLGLSSIEEITSLHDRLDKWIADISDVTLQVLFQNVINEGHILNYVLQHPDKSWLLQVLGTLFDLIKDETTRQPDLSLGAFLDMIDKMEENSLPLQINKIVSSDKGAHFLTAHSSKGLEYKEVIVIGATKDIWDSTRRSNRHYTYPPMMNGDNDVNIEDERRLMYVAMTRAEHALDLSYSLRKENGKDLGASQFIDELIAASELQVSPQVVPEDTVVAYQYNILLKHDKPVTLIDHDLIDRMLDGYKLSVTGLNKYLKCPVTFYFESVLRVPMARTKYLGFGRGVHYALEYFHRDLNDEKKPDQKVIIDYFLKGMTHHRSHFTEQEFRDMNAYGKQILSKYYDQYLTTSDSSVQSYGLEVKVDHAEYEGIPIKGVLDRVAIKKDEVIVTDYKTGNATSQYTKPKLYTPTDRKPEGGDYWRQIVFYKILLDSDRKHNWNMITGIMDFVEPDRKTGAFFKKEYAVSPEQIRIVGEQIKTTWAAIQAHKFEKGCGEDDCQWCNFVQNDYVMDMALVVDEE